MKEYLVGLVGKNISYSFSRQLFTEKFARLGLKNWRYEVFDIPDGTLLPQLFSQSNLIGFNVTIPYKQEIIPYLDALSPEAAAIGAVNTVVKRGTKWIGENTDAFGFQNSLESHLENHLAKAIILGDGGAAKAVRYVLDRLKIPHKTYSRRGENLLKNLSEEVVAAHQLIIQTTPVGTFPEMAAHLPFPFAALTPEHLIIDLIYNPAETAFMKLAENQGATAINGLEMLYGQAEKAWELWQAAADNL